MLLIPYRDDNPTLRTPLVTLSIIGLNVLVFLYQLTLPEEAALQFVRAYAFVPGELYGFLPPSGLTPIPDYLTLVTSMFIHGSLLHLAGNMLYLWVFGNNIEDAMGPVRFTAFYLLCGL